MGITRVPKTNRLVVSTTHLAGTEPAGSTSMTGGQSRLVVGDPNNPQYNQPVPDDVAAKAAQQINDRTPTTPMKKGGKVKAKPKKVMAKDTKATKVYARGGGIEQRGKTRGKFV